MNDLNVSLFCAASILLFLSWSAVSARCFVRIRLLKAVGIDDYFMIAALIFYTLAEGFTFDAIRITESTDGLEELLEVLSRGLRDMYLGEIFYVLSVWNLKLSIGAFLLRLVSEKRRLRNVIIFTLAIVSLWSTVYIFMVIFQCWPVSHFWEPMGEGTCLPGRVETGTSYAHAAVIGTSDLIFAILPLFVVWNLKMNKAMKLSVAGLLGLGAIGGITSFLRMPYIKALSEAASIDFFAVTARLAIWTCVEPGVGIFVGSVAALRPLFRRFLGGSSVHRTNSSYWPASRPDPPHDLENLGDFVKANKKIGLTTTVIEAGGKRVTAFFDDNDSEEVLHQKKSGGSSKEGITTTREFESVISEAARSSRTVSPVEDLEHGIASRGGFY